MADLIRFVDSVDASPTVRLDLNDEANFWTKSFSAPPPRLRRSVAANAMRDGISVGSASYDGRTLTIELETIHASQDLAAVQMQNLWRELDRETNWLMYQPSGATKPVFFRTFRSDASQLADVMAQAAMRTFTIELLAEPFALGLKETLGPYTINNDPAAASNGCYFDVTGVVGDVASPVVMTMDGTGAEPDTQWLATTRSQTAGSLFEQAESLTFGTDTTNPGGAADAAMSGAGSTNYARTTFATDSTLVARVTLPSSAQSGALRLLARVRVDASTTVTVQAAYGGLGGSSASEVLGSATTASGGGGGGAAEIHMLDLGVFNFPTVTVGATEVSNPPTADQLSLAASRTAGAGGMDWDYLAWVPADEQVAILSNSSSVHLVDGEREVFAGYDSGDPLAGTAVNLGRAPASMAGSFPYVSPNVTNRFVAFSAADVAASRTVNLAYWPRYIHSRPSAT